MSGPNQISSQHRERLAVVYIRQSTLAQVRENIESTNRQYGLVEEAVRLGWESGKVVILDGDLGRSGRSTTSRTDFQELVSRVCLGEVGAVFGLEVSRLARNSADFQRLLEFCSLTDTLIIDADGVYDLRRSFNDRLLLGLKGTMSEAELHILAGRLQESKRAAARRGELHFPLPIGYLYDDDGRTVMDPNEEVCAAVADVFAAFHTTGSAYGVVGVMADRPFPRRAYGGAWAGDIRWGRLTHSRTLGLLSNPAYAGAYVFGRFRSQRSVDADGTIRTRTVELPREQWGVVLQDHHPGYISWETFLANQERLAANYTRSGARPPREGSALLQGLVLCGGCGQSMSVLYSSSRASYDCSNARANHTKLPGCRSVTAAVVDPAVARRLLEVVAPEQIALALAAADQVTERRARASRALELQVERARYEAARAERAFHLCEPENRLVARSLEQRWEDKLTALARAEAALATADAEAAPLPSRAELEALAADLPRLWAAPTSSDKDRKRLLRTLIADVTLVSQPEGDEVRIGIHWRTGATEEVLVTRPGAHGRTRPEVLDSVEAASDLTAGKVATKLNAAGLRTGFGREFDGAAVRWLRWRYDLPRWHSPFRPGELGVKQVADRLGIRDSVVYSWIHNGRLQARHAEPGRFCIPFPPEVEAACRQLIARSVRIKPLTQIALAGGAV